MSRLARFAWLVLAWNVVVILWGAFVRATGSGAGCGAHWPLCNGEVMPRAPAVATMIEFLHRATSGLALFLVLALALWVFRARPARHPARRAAAGSLLLILSEAGVGAALVLLRLVAQNESVGRALFMALHLVNTFALLACLTLTARFVEREPPTAGTLQSPSERWAFTIALGLLVVVGASGAVAALGDTLYPAQSLLGALAQDLSASASLLVRLRLAHPLFAVAGALAAIYAASRVLQSGDEPGARRVAWTVSALSLAQIACGLLNVALLAPVWLQLMHLLLADLLWIALVLLAAHRLTRQRTASAA